MFNNLKLISWFHYASEHQSLVIKSYSLLKLIYNKHIFDYFILTTLIIHVYAQIINS